MKATITIALLSIMSRHLLAGDDLRLIPIEDDSISGNIINNNAAHESRGDNVRFWTELKIIFPDADNIVQSPEFIEWLDVQSDEMKKLASINDISAAEFVLTAFKTNIISQKQGASKETPIDRLRANANPTNPVYFMLNMINSNMTRAMLEAPISIEDSDIQRQEKIIRTFDRIEGNHEEYVDYPAYNETQNDVFDSIARDQRRLADAVDRMERNSRMNAIMSISRPLFQPRQVQPSVFQMPPQRRTPTRIEPSVGGKWGTIYYDDNSSSTYFMDNSGINFTIYND